jgi:hypothetical protein
MKKSILEIYGLAVCFAIIGCFVISLGVGTYDLIQISAPEFTLNSYEVSRHQTNEVFWSSCKNKWKECEKEDTRPPEDELTKQRKASYKRVLQAEKRDAFQSLTKAVVIIIINTIVFVIHWQIARHTREANIVT